MTPKKDNQTTKQTVTKSTKVLSFQVDFGAIDEIRNNVKAWRREYLTQTTSGKKARHLHAYSYETAAFYIGRTTLNVHFVRINLPVAAVTRLAKRLELAYPEYGVYWHHRDIYVYLRGIPLWERGRL